MQAPRAFFAFNINDDEASKQVSDKQYLLKRHRKENNIWCQALGSADSNALCAGATGNPLRMLLFFFLFPSSSHFCEPYKILLRTFICKKVAVAKIFEGTVAANKKTLIFRLSMIYCLRTLVSEIGWILLFLLFTREILAVEGSRRKRNDLIDLNLYSSSTS